MQRLIAWVFLVLVFALVSYAAYAQGVFEPSDAVQAVVESPNLSGSVTFSGMTANTMVYLDGAKILTSTSSPTNGQLLIGNTGNAPSIGSITGTTNQITVTPGAGTVTLSAPQNLHTDAMPTFAGIIYGTQTVTILDDGAGTSPGTTITPTASLVLVDCQDANNCTATMGESGITSGQLASIIVTSVNTVAFSDAAGVSELAGAFTAGAYDALSLVYVTDRWVEYARSNN